MPVTHIFGLLLLLQLAACAIISPAHEPAAAQGGTVVVERLPSATQDQLRSIDTPGGTLIIERLPPMPEVVPEVPVGAAPLIAPVTVLTTPPMIVPPTPPVVSPDTPATVNPPPVTPPSVAVPPAATVSPAAATPAAPDKVVAKPPVKAVAPVVRAAPPQKPVASARATASTLDLDALEQRLKDTDAIGVFTKIALKNQVDDLLKRFKAYHESDGKTALTQLRQSYDQLLLKVNDVLKNGDPSLAGEIMGSREAIWGLLSDPVKFAKL